MLFLSSGSEATVVGRINTASGLVETWQVVFGLAADGKGAVYFQEFGSDVRNVARLVPATNVLTEWGFSPDGEFDQNMILESAKLLGEVMYISTE